MKILHRVSCEARVLLVWSWVYWCLYRVIQTRPSFQGIQKWKEQNNAKKNRFYRNVFKKVIAFCISVLFVSFRTRIISTTFFIIGWENYYIHQKMFENLYIFSWYFPSTLKRDCRQIRRKWRLFSRIINPDSWNII